MSIQHERQRIRDKILKINRLIEPLKAQYEACKPSYGIGQSVCIGARINELREKKKRYKNEWFKRVNFGRFSYIREGRAKGVGCM